MTWTERTDLRHQRSKTYQDDADPLKRHLVSTLATLHRESAIDTGVYDALVDLTPVRVDVPAFEGWRVTAADWHYALGKDLANHGDQDGWVGFGGRQGAHWFKFRLLRVGYLHWPTRAWDDVGGAPDYDRANLTNATHTLTLAPNDDEIHVESVAKWADLWTTPGGGSLDVTWKARGDQLKEEITINQAARSWITANHPPSTPLAETWFGFVFDLDWSDVPKVIKNALQQDMDGDFSDDDHIVELRDALDQLLALLPVSDLIVIDGEDEAGRATLRKRFWFDGTNHRLLVGVRCDVLAALPAGDLVFDPTIDDQVGAGANDTYDRAGGTFDATAAQGRIGLAYSEGNHVSHRFTNISGLSGATIDVSYTELNRNYSDGNVESLIYANDAAAPVAPTNHAEFAALVKTTANVTWDFTPAANWNQSPSINTIIQELADSYDPSAIQIIHLDDGAPGYLKLDHYESDSALAPKLHIEYTAAAGGGQPMNLRATTIPRMRQWQPRL